jgi:hypothetical protein
MKTLGLVYAGRPEGVRGMGVKKGIGDQGVVTKMAETKRFTPLSALVEQLRKNDPNYAVCMSHEDAQALVAEIDRLNRWVADCQSGMYINCVYCGHRYPPGTPDVRDKVLYEHIRRCPKHPLQKALEEIESLKKELGRR